MQASEKLFLQTVGRFIADRFKTWIAPLNERIEKVEGMIAAATVKVGNDGNDRTDGKGIDPADVQRMVDSAVAAAVADLPVSPHVVGCYVDRDGELFFNFNNGHSVKAGHVVGKDADPAYVDAQIKAAAEKYPPPKDGKDGFGLDDFDVEFDGDRTITLRFHGNGILKEHKLVGAWPIYRGVWRDGDYQRGDCVTHEGSDWTALAQTTTRPGTPDCAWQLANKKGRDGREGKQGTQGVAGKDGRDGRDLTQIGPDGRKWG